MTDAEYHVDYAMELAEWTAGHRAHPPCRECAGPVRDGSFTGAEVCADCVEEPGWWSALAPEKPV